MPGLVLLKNVTNFHPIECILSNLLKVSKIDGTVSGYISLNCLDHNSSVDSFSSLGLNIEAKFRTLLFQLVSKQSLEELYQCLIILKAYM